MPLCYVAYCPIAEECNHGGRRLGASMDEEEARAKVRNHLQNSSYHYGKHTEDDIEQLVALAELDQEEYVEEAPLPQKGKGGKADDGKGGKGGKGGKEGKRSEPYHGGGGGGKGNALNQLTRQVAELSEAMVAPARFGGIDRCIMAISRAEAAARTSSRMARAAAAAFDEEASHLRSALAELRGDAPDARFF